MDHRHAVREKIRDDYESKCAKEQGTTRMKAVEVHLELRTTSRSAKDLLHQIDSAAPVPQALDGKGPVVYCILDVRTLLFLYGLVEDGFCSLLIPPIPLEIEEATYRPDWYVHRTIEGSLTITSHP